MGHRHGRCLDWLRVLKDSPIAKTWAQSTGHVWEIDSTPIVTTWGQPWKERTNFPRAQPKIFLWNPEIIFSFQLCSFWWMSSPGFHQDFLLHWKGWHNFDLIPHCLWAPCTIKWPLHHLISSAFMVFFGGNKWPLNFRAETLRLLGVRRLKISKWGTHKDS